MLLANIQNDHEYVQEMINTVLQLEKDLGLMKDLLANIQKIATSGPSEVMEGWHHRATGRHKKAGVCII